jgi:ubiquinone/menaquinone biosynthesis C-methylase UbiE
MIGVELLDDPHAEPSAVRAQLADIARLNQLCGGTRAVVDAIEPFLQASETGEGEKGTGTRRWTLLDVGTGLGDIPRAVAACAGRYGITLSLVGVERNPTAARAARATGLAAVLADGGALPLGPGAVDVVIASQVLHHLPRERAVRWVASFDRVARRAVILADLRRSRVAMAGIWAASLGLGFGRQTRHDAVLSLRRGYTREEFNAMLREAGVRAVARYRPGFRIVAAWSPGVGLQ